MMGIRWPSYDQNFCSHRMHTERGVHSAEVGKINSGIRGIGILLKMRNTIVRISFF